VILEVGWGNYLPVPKDAHRDGGSDGGSPAGRSARRQFCRVRGLPAGTAAAKTAIIPLFGLQPAERTGRVITLVVLLIQVVLVVTSARLASMINSGAVAIELGIVAVLSIALIVAVAVAGNGSTATLVSRGVAARSPDYFAIGGGLMDAMIMGLATLVGFDSAANLAEEAKDPYRSVPRAIVGSVLAAGALGLVFLITLTVAIDSIPRVPDLIVAGLVVAGVLFFLGLLMFRPQALETER
jgi:amino acid transporter